MIETPHSVLPPLSVVRIARVPEGKSDWAGLEGRVFRVGYYRKRDGLDCIWLVDNDGIYCKTVDQETFRTAFEVIALSSVTDLFGVNSAVIQAVPIIPATPCDRLTRKATLLIVLCALLIAIVFGSYGYLGRGRAVGICASIFFTTIWLR
jgi:hypothetical protein